MKLTDEEQEWMIIALRLGEDNMELFSESLWEHIAEPQREKPLAEQDIFTRYYIKFGGTCFDELGFYVGYHDDEALDKAKDYAGNRITDAFTIIEKQFKLYSED
jgi:hypothetical protein